MGALEQVTQLRGQGYSDEEIIAYLKEQKVSPKEINNALNQSQIKEAVSGADYESYQESPLDNPPEPGGASPNRYTPQTQEIPENQYATINPQEYYYPQQPQGELYTTEGQYNAGFGTDTIMEIAEQVFSERDKKNQKKIAELTEFRTLAQLKIDNLLERIKKMETIIDKLQISILDKVGSYGKNIEGIKKEMSMMQDSFGKLINPILEGKTRKKSSKE